MSSPLVVTPTLTIPADDLRWTAARASGPGGQNVNKVSSKVELRFDLTKTTALDVFVRARLLVLAKNKLDNDGCLLIVVQETRDQVRNLDIAREKLAELVRQALVRPKTRRATRPTRGSKERRLDGKKKDSAKKRDRTVKSED